MSIGYTDVVGDFSRAVRKANVARDRLRTALPKHASHKTIARGAIFVRQAIWSSCGGYIAHICVRLVDGAIKTR
jgi:hypothetical protein